MNLMLLAKIMAYLLQDGCRTSRSLKPLGKAAFSHTFRFQVQIITTSSCKASGTRKSQLGAPHEASAGHTRHRHLGEAASVRKAEKGWVWGGRLEIPS